MDDKIEDYREKVIYPKVLYIIYTDKVYPHSFIHLFDHSFNRQMPVKSLVYAKHCPTCLT